MGVLELEIEALFAKLRDADQKPCEVGYSEGARKSRDRSLTVVCDEVKYDFAIVRYALTITDHEAEASSACI